MAFSLLAFQRLALSMAYKRLTFYRMSLSSAAACHSAECHRTELSVKVTATDSQTQSVFLLNVEAPFIILIVGLPVKCLKIFSWVSHPVVVPFPSIGVVK